MKYIGIMFILTGWLLSSAAVQAHGSSHHGAVSPKHTSGNRELKAFGQAGDPSKVSRDIQVFMDDKMRFVPGTLTIQKGETVRLRVTNRGAVLHELVIGTAKELAEHAEMMRKFPGMEHDAPHMAHVKPGRQGEIVWQFTQPGEFQFACLIPGHFEAGMVGKVVVK